MKLHTLGGFITAFALAGLLGSGCAGGPGRAEGANDAMTPTEALAEYRAEAGQLDLAPGWKWPDKPDFDESGPDGRPMTYQRGYGKTMAAWYWYCSWGRTFLSADGAEKEAAFAEVSKIRDTFFYKVALLPPDRAVFENALSKAALGDTSEIAEDVEVNCPATSS